MAFRFIKNFYTVIFQLNFKDVTCSKVCKIQKAFYS